MPKTRPRDMTRDGKPRNHSRKNQTNKSGRVSFISRVCNLLPTLPRAKFDSNSDKDEVVGITQSLGEILDGAKYICSALCSSLSNANSSSQSGENSKLHHNVKSQRNSRYWQHRTQKRGPRPRDWRNVDSHPLTMHSNSFHDKISRTRTPGHLNR